MKFLKLFLQLKKKKNRGISLASFSFLQIIHGVEVSRMNFITQKNTHHTNVTFLLDMNFISFTEVECQSRNGLKKLSSCSGRYYVQISQHRIGSALSARM